MPTAFVLLLLALAAAWWPAPRAGWPWRLPPWAGLYLAAVAVALAEGQLQWPALPALAAVFLLAARWPRARGAAAWALWMALAGLCAALLLHRWPGFRNPVLFDAVRWSADAAAFTQHLNFDKGSVGLALLVAWRARAPRAVPGRVPVVAGVVLATLVLVFTAATLAGVVRPAPKWSAPLALFLLVNLALTCVAEEGVFRTLLQDPLAGRAGNRWRVAVAAAASALLFGLAHAAGGPAMGLLAGLSGLGAATAYALTRRLEVPILLHFSVNAVHALGFTYPALAPG